MADGGGKLEPASGSAEEAEVVDAREASRYELRLDGRLIGRAAYRRRDGLIVFLHTEVDHSREGHGFGSRLAAGALDDVRRQGLGVIPRCPFIAQFIAEHPEYEDLVDADYRAGDETQA